jgi:site-specific recombinase XerD
MTNFLASAPYVLSSDHAVLRAAAAAYLDRYRGASRLHTASDLRIFLSWCAGQDLDPLATVRADIERYVRWLQEARRYQPSTVSRRLSVVVGFYRVCVIDGILAHSPRTSPPEPTGANRATLPMSGTTRTGSSSTSSRTVRSSRNM